MKVLITGGAGFIGSSLADRISEIPGIFVTIIDNLATGYMHNIPKKRNVSFIKGNVNNYNEISAVMLNNKFDFVFHYAAYVGVNRTINNPVQVLEDVQGLKNVFELCRMTEVKRIFYSSSSEVYGEPVHLPQHEIDTPLNSKLPYAVVKNLGECFCRSYLQEYGLSYTIFRFFNTYGPKQSADFVISKFINSAIKGADITIYGNGEQTRTFCYIDDHISATVNAFLNGVYINNVVNIGNDKLTTINELAQIICDYSSSKSEIRYVKPLKEGDMSRRQPDVSKMKLLLGKQFISLDEGISLILKTKALV